MKRLLIGLIVLYIVAYAGLRVFNTQVWDKDGNSYVIFPASPIAIYYLFRPLTYLDGAVTGMRFHIGPHK